MQHLALEPVEAARIIILVDNTTDTLVSDQGPAKRADSIGRPPLIPSALIDGGTAFAAPVAEHGFSALVTVGYEGRERHVLFDAGMTQNGLVENMRCFALSPNDIEAVVLSHGHPDHIMGLHGLVRDLGGVVDLPMLVHPDLWSRRRIVGPGREPSPLFPASKPALMDAGFRIREERGPSMLFDRSLLVTGEVERTTEFERGLPGHQAWLDGEWRPDPLILDDQALLINVRDKGLVVLTGCGHSGIVNIVRYARKLTGIEPIYAVIGGFHLSGPLSSLARQTAQALAAFDPDIIVPAHCTGFPAMGLLAAQMPGAFIQSTVGTRFDL